MIFSNKTAVFCRATGAFGAGQYSGRRSLTSYSLLVLYLCVRASLAGATTAEHGPSPEIAGEATATKIEIARLRVHNIAGGAIEGSRDGGQTWWFLGRVVQPTMKVNRRGFNASKYVPV